MLKLIIRSWRTIVPAFILFIFFTLTSCSPDEPEVINEPEVITHVNLIVTDPSGSIQTAIWTKAGISGDTPIELTSGLNYQASLQFWNRSNPNEPENITTEIREEVDEHQVFYQLSGIKIDITSASADLKDSDGVPLLLNTTWKGTATGSGTVRVTLIHEPFNKGATTRATIGGETDVEIDFKVSVSAAN